MSICFICKKKKASFFLKTTGWYLCKSCFKYYLEKNIKYNIRKNKKLKSKKIYVLLIESLKTSEFIKKVIEDLSKKHYNIKYIFLYCKNFKDFCKLFKKYYFKKNIIYIALPSEIITYLILYYFFFGKKSIFLKESPYIINLAENLSEYEFRVFYNVPYNESIFLNIFTNNQKIRNIILFYMKIVNHNPKYLKSSYKIKYFIY